MRRRGDSVAVSAVDQAGGSSSIVADVTCGECGTRQTVASLQGGSCVACGKPVAPTQSDVDRAQGVVARTPAPPLLRIQQDFKDHDPDKVVEAARDTGIVADARDEGDAVSATWGSELYSPVKYNTCEVGPFSGTTRVRAGESRVVAHQRLLADLAAVAAEERARKLNSFTASLAKLGGDR